VLNKRDTLRQMATDDFVATSI